MKLTNKIMNSTLSLSDELTLKVSKYQKVVYGKSSSFSSLVQVLEKAFLELSDKEIIGMATSVGRFGTRDDRKNRIITIDRDLHTEFKSKCKDVNLNFSTVIEILLYYHISIEMEDRNYPYETYSEILSSLDDYTNLCLHVEKNMDRLNKKVEEEVKRQTELKKRPLLKKLEEIN